MDFSGDSWERPDLWPYQKVAAVIAGAIESGELPPGQRLPSQQHLAQMAGVSKTAVQNALAVLHDQGLVRSVPRLGVFVTERKPE
jgi:GntR family transcriptional regulator